MKSRIPQISYIELPLKVFAEKFPHLYSQFSYMIDTSDNDYIVRMRDNGNGYVDFELGYASDDWKIK